MENGREYILSQRVLLSQNVDQTSAIMYHVVIFSSIRYYYLLSDGKKDRI